MNTSEPNARTNTLRHWLLLGANLSLLAVFANVALSNPPSIEQMTTPVDHAIVQGVIQMRQQAPPQHQPATAGQFGMLEGPFQIRQPSASVPVRQLPDAAPRRHWPTETATIGPWQRLLPVNPSQNGPSAQPERPKQARPQPAGPSRLVPNKIPTTLPMVRAPVNTLPSGVPANSPRPNKLPDRENPDANQGEPKVSETGQDTPTPQEPTRRIDSPKLHNDLFQQPETDLDQSLEPSNGNITGNTDGPVIGHDAQGNPISNSGSKSNEDLDKATADLNSGGKSIDPGIGGRSDDAFNGHRRGPGNAPLFNPRYSGSAMAGPYDNPTSVHSQFKVTQDDKVYVQVFEKGDNWDSQTTYRIKVISAGEVLDLIDSLGATTRRDSDGSILVRVLGKTAEEIALVYAKGGKGSNSPDETRTGWQEKRFLLSKMAQREPGQERYNPWIDQYGNPIANREQSEAESSEVSNTSGQAKSRGGHSGDLKNPVPDGQAGTGGGKAPIDPDPDSPGRGSPTTPKLHPNIIKNFQVIDPIDAMSNRPTLERQVQQQ